MASSKRYFGKFLAEPSLRDACNELGTVSYKWFPICVQLGVPHHKLKEFEREHDPLSAAIDYWLRGNVSDVPITWSHLADALERADETGVADTIRINYCGGKAKKPSPIKPPSHPTPAEPAPLPPSQPMSVSQQEVNEFSELMDKDQLHAFLLFEQMKPEDCEIIKENSIGGAVFLLISESEWKQLGISMVGMINLRRIQAKIQEKKKTPAPNNQQFSHSATASIVTAKPHEPTADAMNKPITEVHLDQIARGHCKEWRFLYHYMERMEKIHVDDVEREKNNEMERRLAFLNLWKERNGSGATYAKLIFALLKRDCRQDAEFVKQLCHT